MKHVRRRCSVFRDSGFLCQKGERKLKYYDKDQIAQAREMDLLTYLQRYEPDELIHDGGYS